MNSTKSYLDRAVDLASKGSHLVCPNPKVGCVVVVNDKIISEGYHRYFGGPHAEVEALQNISDKYLLSKATVYVSLEPCSYFGKTPPCANLLIEKGIKKVVIGSLDPNPKVNGKGAEILRNARIEVEIVQHDGCLQLNPKFNFFHQKSQPFITLKWAQTADGFMGRLQGSSLSNKISSDLNQVWVHKLRSENHAILVGTHTALYDNPSLDNRLWIGRNPVKILIDQHLVILPHFKIFQGEEVIVLNDSMEEQHGQVRFVKVDFPLEKVKLQSLFFSLGIQSILVEGGAKTLAFFIENNWWNDAFITKCNMNWEKGIKAPKIISKNQHQIFKTGVDQVFHYTQHNV